VDREPANVRQFALGVSKVILKANANLLSVYVIYPSPQVNTVIILHKENHARYSTCLGKWFYNIHRNVNTKQSLCFLTQGFVRNLKIGTKHLFIIKILILNYMFRLLLRHPQVVQDLMKKTVQLLCNNRASGAVAWGEVWGLIPGRDLGNFQVTYSCFPHSVALKTTPLKGVPRNFLGVKVRPEHRDDNSTVQAVPIVKVRTEAQYFSLYLDSSWIVTGDLPFTMLYYWNWDLHFVTVI
jgi:hypothetical protein